MNFVAFEVLKNTGSLNIWLLVLLWMSNMKKFNWNTKLRVPLDCFYCSIFLKTIKTSIKIMAFSSYSLEINQITQIHKFYHLRYISIKWQNYQTILAEYAISFWIFLYLSLSRLLMCVQLQLSHMQAKS